MASNLEFRTLLVNLQDVENDVRNQSEKTYEDIDPKVKFELLLQLLTNSEEVTELRIFAGVLCRRLLDTSLEEAYKALPIETQLFTKEKLLEWVVVNSDATIRKKLAEIIIEIAKEDFDSEGNLEWKPLLTFVFDTCINSEDSGLNCVGLQIFGAIPHILGPELLNNLDNVTKIFLKTMTPNGQNIEVRIASVKTFSSFILSQTEENNLSQFRTLVPLILKTTADSIMNDTDDDTCLKALVDIADTSALFLKPNINEVLDLCLSVLQNESLDEIQKNLAVEVFVSLSENCPSSVRKCSAQLQTFVHNLLKMLTELAEDPEWALQDTEDDEDESNPSIVAEMALDRLSCAMRGRKMLQEITRTVPSMLVSSKWEERHGGLMAISSCAEGLNKVMEDMLGSIVNEIVPLIADPHPRVRYAACNAIGQLSTDFAEKLQKNYHEKVMPALLSILDDNEHPRVQAYGGAALVNFCESATKSVNLLYLPTLSEKLLFVLQTKYNELLQTNRKLVLEQIVTTIAALADSCAESFFPYYERFMPFLKFLLQQCNTDHLRLLKGKTIECISLMGLAVGREKFLADAQDVMQLLLKSQTELDVASVTNSDDPSQSYMISAWARMCKLLGKSFAEFLPLVMKSVLKVASIKPDVCMMYNEDAEEMDKNWQMVKIADDQNFAIHTSGLEDKAIACQMLVCYAKELTDAFCPYVSEVAELMIPLLGFYFNDEVRSSAADILPYLIESSKPLGDDSVLALWDRIFEALIKSILSEPYKQQIADMLESLSECIKKMANKGISPDKVEKLIHMLNNQFEELFKNQETRAKKRKSVDYEEEEDEEVLANEQEEDEIVLCKIVDVVRSVLLSYGSEALPVIFEPLLPNIEKLTQPNRPVTDLEYGLCFWSDMVECCGSDSWRYAGQFLHITLSALKHSNKNVRQSACYAFGVMAMHGGVEYCDALREATPILMQIVQVGGANSYERDDETNMSTENAISALTKIFRSRPECIPHSGDVDSFLGTWLQWLPIWEDTEETPYVYGLLCEMVIDRAHPIVLGPNSANMPHIIRSIAFCLEKEGLPESSPVYARCLELVRAVQLNQTYFAACVENMTPEEQTALKKALESVA